jgi:hypothetical protein
MVKLEARVIGIDDGPFVKHKDKHVLIVGVVYRGGNFPDGVLSTTAAVDGTDATQKIARMISKSKFRPQLQAILLKGVAVGGFNVIDLDRLYHLTRRPVIVVVRDYPDFDRIYRALRMLKKKKAIALIKKLPPPVKVGQVYVQYVGTDLDTVKELLRVTCTRSLIPEPVRVAHLIAAGIVKGESRGRA